VAFKRRTLNGNTLRVNSTNGASAMNSYMRRLLCVVLMPFSVLVFSPQECAAQPPGEPLITREKVQAAATALSERAVVEVQHLQFGSYRGDKGVLIAEGDSWFDYFYYDVLQYLEGAYHYKVESTARAGDTLESMVYDNDQLTRLALKMSRLAALKVNPAAILLSGGGNDIAGPELTMLLNHANSNLPPLNEDVVFGVLNVRLRMSYLTFIQSITNLSNHYFGRAIPVLIHGYDYPVPDGRGVLGGRGALPGPWFKPFFEKKGYLASKGNTETLHKLVYRFNAVLEAIPNEPGFGHVCYVRVLEILSTSLAPPHPYDEDWGNELHPTQSGFRKVAAEFQGALVKCAHVK